MNAQVFGFSDLWARIGRVMAGLFIAGLVALVIWDIVSLYVITRPPQPPVDREFDDAGSKKMA